MQQRFSNLSYAIAIALVTPACGEAGAATAGFSPPQPAAAGEVMEVTIPQLPAAGAAGSQAAPPVAMSEGSAVPPASEPTAPTVPAVPQMPRPAGWQEASHAKGAKPDPKALKTLLEREYAGFKLPDGLQ